MLLKAEQVYDFGPYRLDPRERQLLRNGEPVPLPPRAFDLLLALVARAGTLATKEELLAEVWAGTFVEETNLSYTISLLRKALGEEGYIETVPKSGYRFIALVSVVSAVPADAPLPVPRGAKTPKRWSARWLAALTALGLLVVTVVTLLLVFGSNVERLRPWWREPTTVPRIESLAVLPLSNLMGSEDQEYYVAAMHEALIGELGKIGALNVRSRTSVMQYRSRVKPVPEIARDLDVDYLVEGSMFKSGDRVRVRVLLFRARPLERELWSKTFDGELRNILTLQSDVARAIAEGTQVAITPMESARLTTTRAVDPRAYDEWAKGWFQFNRVTVYGMNQCLEHTTSALSLDSSYAAAYALRASCLSLLPQLSGAAPSDAYPKAAEAARRALSLDPNNAEAHFGLAWTLASYDWDWPGAEREYRRGLELIPSSAFGHSRFGWFLSWLGRDAEAMEEVTRALQLNPTGPNEMQRAAAVHFVARRYDAAIIEAQRAIRIDPTFTFAYVRLGQAYTEKRMYEQAVAASEKALQLSGGFEGRGNLGRAYALWGRPGEARRVLDELLSGNPKGYAGPFHIAQIYGALGQKDEALHWLEEAYREHDGNIVLLKVFPAWDSLRSDPRFQDLVRRMNYP